MKEKRVYKLFLCKICNKEIKINIFGSHLKYKHNINSKTYYDRYIKKQNEGICPTCGKESNFKSITKGYYTFCSVKCSINNEKTINKKEKTMVKLYGVKNPSQSEIIKQKKKNTLMKHYGVDNYTKTKGYKEKLKKIGKIKYNIDNMTNTSQIPLSRAKTKQTNLKKYGHTCNLHSVVGKYKTKNTNIKKYGVENVFKSKKIQQKINQTKRRNKTFSTSSTEDMTFIKLMELYGKNNVLRQYKNELYPFNCDFYITTKDLYIECNYHWTHNNHFFDKTNEQDIKELEFLKEKAKTSKYYKNAIDVWTNLDKKKQKCLIENNLNYLIFWSYKDFEKWYNINKTT